MSQSKISKIETGFYEQLVSSEIEHILNILDAPKTISQQIFHAIEDEAHHYTVRKIVPRWKDAAVVLRRERETKLLRMFQFQMFPAILQTFEYRKALLGRYNQNDSRDDIIMKRQDLLWSGGHKYHIILHELSLYTIFSSRRVHRAQLDRLERFIGAEYVKIGVIPLTVGMSHFENSSFNIYDERLVLIVAGSIEIDLETPRDITEHLSIFEAIDKKACYDIEARGLIRKAMDYFNQI